MTRQEATDMILRILADEVPLDRSEHARERLCERGYSPNDVRAILRVHRMPLAPKWEEQHQNYKVVLQGKCLEGRHTKVVLGLRQVGPCVLVTIMPVPPPARRTI